LGHRAYFPVRRNHSPREEVLASFLAQFLHDESRRPGWSCCRTRSRSRAFGRCALHQGGLQGEVSTPRRGEKKELIAHALTNAREALGRKLADTATQGRLLAGLVTTLGLPHPPSGSRSTTTATSRAQRGGRHDRGGTGRFIKNQYRKFNIKSKA